MKRKLFLYIIIFMFVLSSVFIIPVKKASANPLIPAAAGTAAGAYAYAALVLTAGYGISQINEDTGQLIVNHALDVYHGLNDTVKNAWELAVEGLTYENDIDYSALLLPVNGISSLGDVVNNVSIGRDLSGITTNKINSFKDGYYNYRYSPGGKISITDTLNLDYVFISCDKGVVKYIAVKFVTSSGIEYSYYPVSSSHDYVYPGFEQVLSGPNIDDFANFYSINTMVNAALNMHLVEHPPLASVTVPTDVALNIPKFPIYEYSPDGKPIKLGIPLPFFDGSYVSDGDVPVLDVSNPSDAPFISDGGDVGTGGGVGSGEYGGVLDNILGGISGIFNFLKDILQKILDFIKSILAVLGVLSLLQTITDFLTGILTGLLDGIGASLTAIEEFFSDGLLGNLNINWSKLKNIGVAFTTAFPFSLPWDIGHAFDSVFGNFTSSDAPEWILNIYDHQFTIRIPDMLLSWFPITKMLILVMFDIGLIYSVRKLLGGAS